MAKKVNKTKKAAEISENIVRQKALSGFYRGALNQYRGELKQKDKSGDIIPPGYFDHTARYLSHQRDRHLEKAIHLGEKFREVPQSDWPKDLSHIGPGSIPITAQSIGWEKHTENKKKMREKKKDGK